MVFAVSGLLKKSFCALKILIPNFAVLLKKSGSTDWKERYLEPAFLKTKLTDRVLPFSIALIIR